jgi:trehalose/maltose transport system substrate-binding protein
LKQEPITLTYFRLGWSQPDDLPSRESLSQQFVSETGILLRDLPVPEATLDQLSLTRKLLEEHSSNLDVLNIDVVWPALLENDLLDLRYSLADELAAVEPHLLSSYEVDGKLVAIPYTVQIGVLEYRSDLLREYGYRHPPRTWDELEKMAARIQSGERAKGRKDFWGYVWQGAASEALACNALEWQVAEGGGRVVEQNRSISVNNPAAVRSWRRAKRWIGWISPPGVLSYQELDSINVFDKGGAAFGRVWGGAPINRDGLFRQLHWRSSLAQSKTGYTSIPGSEGGSGATLGGSGLAISKYSLHQQEAIKLVKFLVQAQMHSALEQTAVVSVSGIHDMSLAPVGRNTLQKPVSNPLRFVSRPSSETGARYEQVTRAYIATVHSVLTGEKSAALAAASLEKQLSGITGFKNGPPLKE